MMITPPVNPVSPGWVQCVGLAGGAGRGVLRWDGWFRLPGPKNEGACLNWQNRGERTTHSRAPSNAERASSHALRRRRQRFALTRRHAGERTAGFSPLVATLGTAVSREPRKEGIDHSHTRQTWLPWMRKSVLAFRPSWRLSRPSLPSLKRCAPVVARRFPRVPEPSRLRAVSRVVISLPIPRPSSFCSPPCSEPGFPSKRGMELLHSSILSRPARASQLSCRRRRRRSSAAPRVPRPPFVPAVSAMFFVTTLASEAPPASR